MEQSRAWVQALRENIGKVLVGKEETIDLVLTTLAAGGHVLVLGLALLAKTAAILAHIRVNAMQRMNTNQSGVPPIIKCEAAPVRAVNVIMNTLVPTAVFNS